jgi:hypothetical protein
MSAVRSMDAFRVKLLVVEIYFCHNPTSLQKNSAQCEIDQTISESKDLSSRFSCIEVVGLLTRRGRGPENRCFEHASQEAYT